MAQIQKKLQTAAFYVGLLKYGSLFQSKPEFLLDKTSQAGLTQKK